MAGVATSDLRSGDRLLPTVLVSGLSLNQVSSFLDPFIISWMKYMDRVYGIQFLDPEGWKSSFVSLLVVVGTGAITWYHMRRIRNADQQLGDSSA